MSSIWFDLRLALRAFGRAKAFVAVAVLSLGLGIGAISTIYLWTDRFFLNPLPGVEGARDLTFIQTRAPGGSTWSISYPTFRDWRDRNRSFSGLAVLTLEAFGIRERDGEAAERAWGAAVSGNYFEVLGTRAVLGRTFRADEDSSAAQVVVLGHDYWSRRFRADPGIVGRRVAINGQSFEVIGVMPPKFGGSFVGLNLDLYLPVVTYPALFGRRIDQRGDMYLEGIGRLAPGVDLAAARADMERVGKELDQVYPDDANTAVVKPLDGQGAPSTMKPIFAALLAVTALVLLIACANVANLLLARATGRQKEFGVRLALGATRPRLIRQLLAESGLLALGGGLVGMYLAYLGRGALMQLLPPVPFPVAFDYDMNLRVVFFALGAAAVAVILFGLGPAFRSSRPDLVVVLKDLRTGSRSRAGARAALVAGQTALAVVALVCAGLFLRAIDRSRRIDPGFRDPDGILLVSTDLAIAGLADSSGRRTIDRLLDRLRAVPGVSDVAVASFVPLGWSCCSSAWIEAEGYVFKPNENRSVVYSRVSDRYFQTMGIPIKSGRSFGPGDGADAPRVAIVNEAFVRRYWPGREALGRTISQAGVRYTVVGVAADGRYRTLTDRAFPLIYRVYAQSPTNEPVIHVRAEGDPVALVPALRAAFQAENPNLGFLDPRTMRQHMQQSTIGQEIGSRTLVVFGVTALFLAAIGIYGVMAYLVGQRTREIGVRVALGAASGDVAGMVLKDGLRITGIGAAIGGLVAVAAGYLLRDLLLGVSPVDPVTFGAIAGVLLAVAGAACLIPARRAAGIDPIIALKSD